MATSDAPLTVPASKNLTLVLSGLPGAPSFTTVKDATSITATITDAAGAVSFESRVNFGAWVSGLVVSGLSSGTSYQFQVRGLNASGNPGAASAAVEVVTDAVSGMPTIFTDDFASGDLSKTQNGFRWLESVSCGVTSTNPNTGTNSLEFTFIKKQTSDEAWAEQNFDLGALHTELEIEYDLYVPDGTEGFGTAAYDHNWGEGTANNKVISIWSSNPSKDAGVKNGYRDNTSATGYEFYVRDPGGVGSRLVSTWKAPGSGSWGPNGINRVYDDFITPADYGTWIHIKIHMKFPTAAGANDGFNRAWRNGVQIIDNPLDNYTNLAGYDNGWQQGYLLGYRNYTTAATQKMWIDNLVVKGVAL